MEGFKASFINEIEKMYKKKKAVVVIIISLITIVMSQLIVYGARYGLGFRPFDGSYFPKFVLGLFVYTILPLFTALVAIDVFTGEFSHNVMKITFTRPVTRIKLFSAKIAAICFFVAVNLLIVMVLSIITGFVFNPASLTAVGILRIVVSYLVTLLPVMVLALLIVFFANFFKSGVAVFFLSILIYIVFIALGLVFSKYGSLFITSFLGWFNAWNSDTLPVGKLLREFLIMLGCGTMLFTAGFYLFDKKDL